jgi:hypothetical protein
MIRFATLRGNDARIFPHSKAAPCKSQIERMLSAHSSLETGRSGARRSRCCGAVS